jgi:hypothetical protein
MTVSLCRGGDDPAGGLAADAGGGDEVGESGRSASRTGLWRWVARSPWRRRISPAGPSAIRKSIASLEIGADGDRLVAAVKDDVLVPRTTNRRDTMTGYCFEEGPALPPTGESDSGSARQARYLAAAWHGYE